MSASYTYLSPDKLFRSVCSAAAPTLGLFAALSRLFDDALEQLNAGLLLYDRCCRDAIKRSHDGPANKIR
ncbi:hypothetical protein [Bradyrhizobium sp. 195]|nr:hypothetical protein IVB26_40255 [Bradyrhizobium sp. 195]